MSLERFLSPRSIAVVGASREQGKVGYEILHNLIEGGFEGTIYPINPKADEIEGLKCFPDLVSIGSVPDLVVVVIPAKFVPTVMEQCVTVRRKIGHRHHGRLQGSRQGRGGAGEAHPRNRQIGWNPDGRAELSRRGRPVREDERQFWRRSAGGRVRSVTYPSREPFWSRFWTLPPPSKWDSALYSVSGIKPT